MSNATKGRVIYVAGVLFSFVFFGVGLWLLLTEPTSGDLVIGAFLLLINSYNLAKFGNLHEFMWNGRA